MSRTVLETRGVSRVLGDAVKQTVLADVDLVIREGEFVALTGHSGSGKSTLLYLLGVLDRPSTGAIFVDGVDTGPLDDDERAALRNEKLGFVFQFHFLLPELSAAENVAVPMLRQGLSPARASARANETLALLGLGDLAKRRPGQLSGGQQQRVSIARAVAHGPRILLADEPTGNLDTENAGIVMDLFERMNREREVAIVMVTHDVAFAERTGRQVALRDGRVVGATRGC